MFFSKSFALTLIYIINNFVSGIEQIHRFHDLKKYLNVYNEKEYLGDLITDLLKKSMESNKNYRCSAIIYDAYYSDMINNRKIYQMDSNMTYFQLLIEDSEDLLKPSNNTIDVLKKIKSEDCETYTILLSNGFQLSRLLIYGDRHRLIKTRANFILLQDSRLFEPHLLYLWKRIINVVFIRKRILKQINDNIKLKAQIWYEINTVPFPSQLKNVLVLRKEDTWKNWKFKKDIKLFTDKTKNLNEHVMKAVSFQHLPAVAKSEQRLMYFKHQYDKQEDMYFDGLEVQLLYTLAKAMNFKPMVYEIDNSKDEQWGQMDINGSINGLLGELVNRKADIGLGDLHHTPFHLNLIDLTVPYNTECLTFLTPESRTDNSWKALILPFKLDMWIGILIIFFASGIIFYALGRFYRYIEQIMMKFIKIQALKNINTEMKIDLNLNGMFIFNQFFNSCLYTYGMLLVVSLPKSPSGWSLRLLTGWYWLYCVLVVVSYRASLTAILANPAPRITIDTLEDLANSYIEFGGWGKQNQQFFQMSLDKAGQKIGKKFELINDTDLAIDRSVAGKFAYYDNQYFLKAVSVKRHNIKMSNDSNPVNNSYVYKHNLHIMEECAIVMPISLGLEKNSPLKPRIDKFLRRIIEAGLVQKWLNDIMQPVLTAEQYESDQFEVKALMDLKKMYGALVALGCGYLISFLFLLGEIIHWKYIVTRSVDFDKYHIGEYYRRQKK